MTELPIIDIGPLFGTDFDSKLNVARQIDLACRKNGFFEIENHKIDTLDSLNLQAFRFFKNLTYEQKINLAPKKWNPNAEYTYRGYFPASVNGKEGFDIGNPRFDNNHELVKIKSPLYEALSWPDEDLLPGFREFFNEFYEKMSLLTRNLMSGFALALGKEETFFNDMIRDFDCLHTCRLNFYPFLENIDAVEIAADGTRLGCETHRDGGLITILYQPIKGLQVETESENGLMKWIDVKPSNKTFIVNTGLCMQRWTNNVYRAANHRVKHVNVERVSVPFFAEPRYDCLIESFTPNLLESIPLFPPIKYGDYIQIHNASKKEYQR
jgi:isopenicillin-N synthase